MLHSNTKPALLIAIDEQLHDVRRVLAQGEEDDLRGALRVVIQRVEEMKGLIAERDKLAANEKEKQDQIIATKEKRISQLETQLAERDVELGVSRSNLKMVTANNEMLEEALRGANGVGWHRRGESAPTPPPPDSRFLNKFRFSRPSTPSTPGQSPTLSHSASTPNLLARTSEDDEQHMKEETERLEQRQKELEALLEKEKQARASLEAELESLSQALFEEANKMVATERRKRAEIEEELREIVQEKDALKNALRIVEGENMRFRASSTDSLPLSGHARNDSLSSIRGTKSKPTSPAPTVLHRSTSPANSSRSSSSRSPSPSLPASTSTETETGTRPPSTLSADPGASTRSLAGSIGCEGAASTRSLAGSDVGESHAEAGSSTRAMAGSALGESSSISLNTGTESGYVSSADESPDEDTPSQTARPDSKRMSAPWQEPEEPSPWADQPGSPPPTGVF